MEPVFTMRPMQVRDIPGAMKLSTAEGWNQTEKDWKLFIENPANICVLAECENKLVGTTTAINYSQQVAWIAMVLVDKEYRGLGISKSLLENVLEQLQTCKSIKLDATAAGRQVYTKFGFFDEYVIARMTAPGVKEIPFEENNEILPLPIQISDIPEVLDFDKTIFGAKRNQLIEFLVKQYPGKAWLLKRNNRVEGIALGRNGTRYHHVGPVFAGNIPDAKMLINTALKDLTGEPVLVDVLCDKPGLVEWLQAIGFVEQRRFVRMYKNDNPYPGLIEKQHLICGPEFG